MLFYDIVKERDIFWVSEQEDFQYMFNITGVEPSTPVPGTMETETDYQSTPSSTTRSTTTIRSTTEELRTGQFGMRAESSILQCSISLLSVTTLITGFKASQE